MKKAATPEAQQFTLHMSKYTADCVAVILHSHCDVLRRHNENGNSKEWKAWLSRDTEAIQQVANELTQLACALPSNYFSEGKA